MVDLSPQELARDLIDKVGLKRSYASQLANRQKTPALPLAVKIERILDIPPSFWVTDEAVASAPGRTTDEGVSAHA
jgi:hypothetical protein